ncbi:helix-turn-helix domain-containing protein [Paenibacillus psychroresistens]|uniref:Helix-turn-helix domain-containing protein n=1 Tax=Paenibacillus psychroresistens TaxID=1778678 RepID=A0A6B8RNA1_9BACL|nr:helix-turn-helix domain-containing protein [Paenibacillus psychroresistens]QGQ97013.1 helix-turn-helix domain-containing protein [Paenibacillus psychroresistens]
MRIYKKPPEPNPSSNTLTTRLVTEEEAAKLGIPFKGVSVFNGKPLTPNFNKSGHYKPKMMRKQEYLDKRVSGMSREQIAEELNIQVPSLYKWLRQWDIKKPEDELAAMEALDVK